MQPFHHPIQRTATPATPESPAYEKESHIGSELATRQARIAADDVVKEYESKRNRLDRGLESAAYLLGHLKNFNTQEWSIRYPHLRTPESDQHASTSARPAMARRTLTFADEPLSETGVVLNETPTARRTVKRSLTLAPSSADAIAGSASDASPLTTETASHEDEDFSILKLDLNMGATRQAKSLISHLEKQSISALLDNRLAASLDHVGLLRKRIWDTQSRVLVSGDVNAGKSTLINALLRRVEVMPTDQQPLTTRFVEVVSAKENNGKEEIHLLRNGVKYKATDPSTFDVQSLDKLEDMVTDMAADADSPPVRVFLKEAATDLANPSILHNGVVDISLIDAPGLNRDSVKTTANFARQEEIDVVVFVVSAANHFTLSAKEFIWQAGHEKAHLFIVVNRFDQIKDKERCRRLVLEQIRQLSPKTYEDAADLVHFVDSAKVALVGDDAGDDLDDMFSHLEHSLRSFVLVNRAKSKLGPAHNYITHLLADIELLASANTLVATREREAARAEVERVKPVLEQMKKGKDGLDEKLVVAEEETVERAASRTKLGMERALERVARGELAAPAPGVALPSYPGLLGVWDYAYDVKRALLASIDFAISLAHDDARQITVGGVDRVIAIADETLPSDVEKSKRVFNPNAMFYARPARPQSRRSSSIHTAGLGLASQSHLVEVSIADIIDIQHHLFIARSQLPQQQAPSSSNELVPFSAEMSGLGALAVGALTLSSKTIGLRHVLDSAAKITELASSRVARRWAGPVIGVVAAGAVAYIIYDLPRSIPRNIGRHLQSTLLISSGPLGSDAEFVPFPDAQSTQVSREVRKVMRMAGADVRDRFRGGYEAKADVVRLSEETEKRASRALAMFADVEKRVEDIREVVGSKL
ncbi:hypothetical protein BCR39DRAFT_262274 [Naematelia encephala]|uniref:Dynamin-type G domain-containing protein n=1 Tax=Naematelia encephala TaxID=71784 RepID=A0A1Y2AWI2_9TREE|nr:hypothetical protein BCR39DRAFT_262274 [Naematelia encephala]